VCQSTIQNFRKQIGDPPQIDRFGRHLVDCETSFPQHQYEMNDGLDVAVVAFAHNDLHEHVWSRLLRSVAAFGIHLRKQQSPALTRSTLPSGVTNLRNNELADL
jgi:hypothetical protein